MVLVLYCDLFHLIYLIEVSSLGRPAYFLVLFHYKPNYQFLILYFPFFIVFSFSSISLGCNLDKYSIASNSADGASYSTMSTSLALKCLLNSNINCSIDCLALRKWLFMLDAQNLRCENVVLSIISAHRIKRKYEFIL